MQPTVVGLFTGLVLGVVLVAGDLADMLLVAFCGAVGYLIMRVVEGEVDLTEVMERTRRRRG